MVGFQRLAADGSRWAWCLVVTAAFISPLVFDPHSADVFNLSKLECITVLVAAAAIAHAIARRPRPSWRTPWLFLGMPVLALLVTAALASLVSIHPVLSILGSYQRYGGMSSLVVYVSAAALVVALSWRRPERLGQLVVGLLAADVALSAYVLAQSAGYDAFRFTDALGNANPYPAGSMGNSNFAGGILGLTAVLWFVPLLGGLGGTRRLIRWASAAGLTLTVAATWATRSRGGLLATLIGVATYALLERRTLPRLVVRVAVAAVVTAASVGTLAVWHPLRDRAPRVLQRLEVLRSESAVIRGNEWRGALAIIRDRPIAGHGPESFAALYPQKRSRSEAERAGLISPDKPHDLWLEQAVGSGALGLAALIALWAMAFTVGVRRLRAELSRRERILLAGFIAMGAAYLAQASFSIDVPPLAFDGWLALAAIAGLADPSLVTRREDRAVEALETRRRHAATKRARKPKNAKARQALNERRPSAHLPPPNVLAGIPRPVRTATVVGLALGAAWMTTLAWSADRLTYRARQLESRGATLDATARSYRLAIRRNPFEASYLLEAGIVAERQADATSNRVERLAATRRALSEYRQADRLRPRTPVFMIRLASALTRLASLTGGGAFNGAEATWRDLLRIDPGDWQVRNGYALHLVAWANATGGDRQRLTAAGREFALVSRAQPALAEPLVNLARVQIALGDTGSARATLRHALARDPRNAEAKRLIDAL